MLSCVVRRWLAGQMRTGTSPIVAQVLRLALSFTFLLLSPRLLARRQMDGTTPARGNAWPAAREQSRRALHDMTGVLAQGRRHQTVVRFYRWRPQRRTGRRGKPPAAPLGNHGPSDPGAIRPTTGSAGAWIPETLAAAGSYFTRSCGGSPLGAIGDQVTPSRLFATTISGRTDHQTRRTHTAGCLDHSGPAFKLPRSRLQRR